MKSKSSWLFITVGAGSKDFEEAAARIHKQASRFEIFDSVVSVKTDALISLFPELGLNRSIGTKGFGYYRWKPRIINLAMSGHWGDFDGVCFVDAGCEMNFNFVSQLRLSRTMKEAEKTGVVAYAISTPERQFTKRKVLEFFDAKNDYSSQFQSGTLFFHGHTGEEIVQEWDRISLLDVSFSDQSLSPGGELADFFEHRHDQSLLSLILKKSGVNPSINHPPGSPIPYRLNLVNLSSPIWWSRNRSGLTTLRRVDKTLTKLTEFFRMISQVYRVIVVLLGKNYVYIRLGGGLGNQLHQFAAAKALSEKLNKELLIDISGLEKSDHGTNSNSTHFQLSSILVHNFIFSKMFLFKRKLYNKLKYRFALKSFYIANGSSYCPDLLSQPSQISYLEGFFHTHKYAMRISRFAEASDLILKNQASEWFQELLAETLHKKVCAIHVRRGDYLKTWRHYGVLSSMYYRHAITEISGTEVEEYWLFSDEELDIGEWDFLDMSKVKVIRPPKESSAAESVVLMSRARWIVTANSTFSWWAGILFSPNPKSVIAPVPFFRAAHDFSELYPPNWQIIPSRWIDY